ncbi:hypothetical protein ACIQVK_43110 [Streptomyces sp. NPDC090493]|uniref:hypothetical protein n=1 Tax=Streptomyces sp. NPDC090493 TaxID=3365964 RepID=UPI0038267A49
MTAVHALIHLHDFDDGSADFKLIGVFTSPDRAEQARAACAQLPGFRDFPDGFLVVLLQVDGARADRGSLPEDLYLLFRTLEDPVRGEEVVVLGAYLSEEEGNEGASAYREGPPEAGLEVSPVTLDERTWCDGFFTYFSDESDESVESVEQ